MAKKNIPTKRVGGTGFFRVSENGGSAQHHWSSRLGSASPNLNLNALVSFIAMPMSSFRLHERR
jgi:hypothetical protein